MLTAEQYLQAEFDYTLAEARRRFKIHAAVYAIVMTGLITLNGLLIAFTDADFPLVRVPVRVLGHRPHAPIHLRLPACWR